MLKEANMLKKAVSVFTFILLFIIVVVLSYNEGCLLALGETVELRAIPAIDQAQMQSITSGKAESTRSFLSFSYDDFELPPYDAERDAYLICQSMLDHVSVFQNIRCDIKAVFSEEAVTIVAVKGDAYRVYSFETTTLPLLFLQTGRPETAPIGDKASSGMFTVLENGAQHAQHYTATFQKRGGMSRQYPKSGMLIKLIDTRGAQVSASILGISENTEFALNALYEDDSKIRDIASLSLWKTISTTGRDTAPAYDISFVMTEAFINGTYAGIYGFHENVNLASFNLAGQSGFSVFKSKSHATERIVDGVSYAESWGDVELKETNATQPWSFFAEAFDRMFHRQAGAGEMQAFDLFDRDNCIDYTIWCNLLVAEDNLWKNVLLITDQSDPAHGRVFVVPWDADLTLGARFSQEAKFNTVFPEENAERELTTSRRNLYGMLWSESGAAFQKDAAERWFALRAGVLSEDALQKSIATQFDLLSESGARARDAARWPQSAQCTDNAFMQTFVTNRLRYLDAFYQSYLQAQD